MKNISISLFFMLGIINLCFAQSQSNLYALKGSSVTAYIVPEMSNSERSYWDTYWSAPGLTEIITSNNYSSSQTFNCHGYAWSIAEGGPTRWIGYYYDTDEDIYITDGGYVQVCSETYPAKVSWGSGDHTAVTTSTSGIWISKWNKYPLMQHAWNDTPYGTTNLKYYVSTKINGDASPLCSGTRSFSVQNITGATYIWSINSALQIVSGQGTSQIVVQRNSSNNGVGTIQVQINTACASATATSPTVSLPVGPPSADNTTLIYPNGYRGVNPVSLCAGCTYNFSVDFVPGATSYTWVLPAGFSFVSGRNSATPGIKTATGNGTYILNCSPWNVCGPAWTHSLTINIGGGGQQQMVAIYPNPASTDLIIELSQIDLIISDESLNVSSPEYTNEIFTAKLYDKPRLCIRVCG